VGVWVAMLASQTFQSLVMLYFFQYKDWTRFAMRKRRNRPAEPAQTTTGVRRDAAAV
jgi:hypothetical protein